MNRTDLAVRWTLKDANFTKDKGKVFSCFACLLVYYLYICGILKIQ